jgi:hypothetical protein
MAEAANMLQPDGRGQWQPPTAPKPSLVQSGNGLNLTTNVSVTRTSGVREPTVRIDDDYYGWLLDQASALRRERPDSLDCDNLAEELEGMARSEESALESHLVVLLKHLLKWRYQSDKRTGSWEASIANSRDQIARLLQKSSSLKSKIDAGLQAAYPLARRKAGAQMGLTKRQWERDLPASCEWGLPEIRDPDFWPEAYTPATNGTH